MTDNTNSIISVKGLTKTYKGGHEALKGIDLEIREGEILALLGPNGAGKTTLISTICGLVRPSSGTVTVGGYDITNDYRKTRKLIGLVPQELTLGAFDLVSDTIRFSRGIFGLPADESKIDELLSDLSLTDKKNAMVNRLSGGMKRRVLIGKALAHEPRILFLDEPTAGVDVELRKDMWALVNKLRQSGVTIILTTHYIEESEEIADRIGVINGGKIVLVENKKELMQKLGKKQLIIEIKEPISVIPTALEEYQLQLDDSGTFLTYAYSTEGDATGITELLQKVNASGITLKDIKTTQSSLEDIFVDLVRAPNALTQETQA